MKIIVVYKIRNDILKKISIIIFLAGGITLLEIVVCEDNQEYRNLITSSLDQIIVENKINASIVLECDSPAIVEKYIGLNAPNVFFLDIDLNAELNGIDLAAMIHEKFADSYIVFISQYTNLVFKSFKVRPFDFLPKPVTKEELAGVLLEINNDYQKRFDVEKPDFLQIKIGGKIYQLPKHEIVFLEKFGNKCIVHTQNKTVYCYQSLETISEKLDNGNFIRCHKSFIVNKSFIEQINLSEMEIILQDGQKCFIGNKYKKDLLSELDATIKDQG